MHRLKISNFLISRIGKYFLLVILPNLLCVTGQSQSKTVKNINQQWIQYYGQLKLDSRWAFFADGGYRVEDNFSKRAQYIARVAMGYALNPSISLAVGFANSGSYTSAKLSKEEFRPYEELALHSKIGNLTFNHRFRVEERYINPVSNHQILHPGTFNFRFRYSFMAGIPIISLSKSKPGSRILLYLGDEIFLNAGKNIVYNVFDQNRLLISPTVQFSPHFSMSLTWNNQFASTSTAGTYNHTQVMWLQIKQDFDLNRKSREVKN